MHATRFFLPLAALLLCACAKTASPPEPAALAQAVADTERAFAQTLARRDLAGFGEFLAEETVFFAGAQALRGKQVVIDHWKRFFEGPAAPFSWAPAQVQVLDSGTLALSSGPVHDPQGQAIGSFTSIWRLEPDGRWRIVFDKGCEVCKPAAP